MTNLPIRVDPEFRDLIPPLASEERQGLEDSIKREGRLLSPLIAWEEENILLDGHNRYDICDLLGISYPVEYISLPDREAAKDWIDKNQVSRRNLSPDQLSILRGRIYNRKKKSVGGDRGNQHTKVAGDQNDPLALPKKTAEKIAKQLGVGEATIKRDGAFAAAVEKLKIVAPELEKKVISGTSAPKAAITKAAKILETNPDAAKAILSGEKKVADVVREEKRQEYQKRVEAVKAAPAATTPDTLPTLVLADPPWKYDFSATENRDIENHYDTAAVSELAMHTPKTADDCVLLLWATAPKLTEAIDLLKAWGFEYKTSAMWDKEIIGCGYWFRGQHELLLVGVKGKVNPPDNSVRVSSVFREKRTEHSKKPLCVYEWIENAFPFSTKLEMYCRNPRAGWQTFGNEVSL